MAVSTTDTYSGPYAANGVTVEFPFTFKAVSADDVAVIFRNISGVETVDSEGNYSVQLSATGGTVVYASPPAASVGDVYIVSEPSFLQSVQFSSGQPFLPTVVNEVNDRDVVRALYLKSRLDRAPQAPLGGGAEGQFPTVLPDGSWGFASGTGSDPAFRSDAASTSPGKGAALIAYSPTDSEGGSTVAYQLSATVYLENFGGIGNATRDGGTDNSSALASAIAFLGERGGTIRGRRGKSYFFADPPPLPRNVKLIAEVIPNKERQELPGPNDYSCSIILPATKTLVCEGAGSQIAGWLIWRQGLVTPTYPAINEAATLAIIAGFAGLAVRVSGDDCEVDHNMFIGFSKAVLADTVFRPKIHDNHADCTSGFEGTNIADCGEGVGFWNNRCWPYLIGSQPYPWAVNRRAGIAFNFHDVCDGLIATGNFAYGYSVSVRLKDVYAMRVGIWADNYGYGDPAQIQGATGVLTEGNCNNCVIEAHVDAHDVNFRLMHTAGDVRIEASTAGLAVTNQIVLGPGSSGTLHASIAGTTETPISVLAGVGVWSGEVRSRSSATSGNLIFFFDVTTDPGKLSDLRRVQIGASLSDPLAGGGVSTPAFRPNPGLPHGMYTPNAQRLGFAVGQKDVLHLQAQGSSVNYLLIGSQNVGGGPELTAEGAEADISILINPKGTGAAKVRGNVLPTSDNLYTLGANGSRMASIWAANGAIQTSDPRQKTDIEMIDPAMAMLIVQMIDPIWFKWIVGGQIIEMVPEEVEEPETETITETVFDEALVDGKLVRSPREVQIIRPVMEMVDVVDEDGNPIMVEVIAPANGDGFVGDGQPRSSATVVIPERKAVPKMRKVMRPRPQVAERNGDRTHAGFNARQVQEVLSIVERDFGGFVIAPDGSLALRPDQMIPVLWAAVKGLMAGIIKPDVPPCPDFLVGAQENIQ